MNADGPDSAYMVYAGRSGATGGIEFDVFFSNNPEDVFATASGELPSPTIQVHEVGADDAVLATGQNDGRGGKWAAVTVRQGRVVFCISIPDWPQAHAQLIALAKLVLARTAQGSTPPAA